MTTSNNKGGNGIRVCARFRPQNSLERKLQATDCTSFPAQEVSVNLTTNKEQQQTFTFDRVFRTDSTQVDVYEHTAKPLVTSVLEGYNCTCFVYGQTGTGKTFSMEGVIGDDEYAGLIPRVMADIFQGISAMEEEVELIVKVSYLEIYLEKIRDLLNPNTGHDLRIRETKQRGVWVEGATEVSCTSSEEMMAAMRQGGSNRVIASTRMNMDSSRSHTVFITTIEQKNINTGSHRTGKLFLVDLAGSEKISKTNAKGQTLKEAKHINKSLSALGSVMNALTSGKQSNGHIPYRDSKLTRLLQDSLGGNSQTTLLVCASCSSYNYEETLSTLRFGSRAKRIRNKAIVNEERTVAEYKKMLSEKEAIIANLRSYSKDLETKIGIPEADVTSLGYTSASTPIKHINETINVKSFDDLKAKLDFFEDEISSKVEEMAILEERCSELEQQNLTLRNRVEVAETSSGFSDIREAELKKMSNLEQKVVFMRKELELKTRDCENSKSLMKELENLIQGQDHTPENNDDTHHTGNEALYKQLYLKEKEANVFNLRIKELSKSLDDGSELYQRSLEEKDLRILELKQQLDQYKEYRWDGMLRRSLCSETANGTVSGTATDCSESKKIDDTNGTRQQLFSSARSMSIEGSKARALKLIRGGSKFNRQLSNNAPKIDEENDEQDANWYLDEQLPYPIPPVNLESTVIQRSLSKICRNPETRAQLEKWLAYILDGHDIRHSNFNSTMCIENLDAESEDEIKRLILPLLRNRADMCVDTFVRRRYVPVSDLKLSLVQLVEESTTIVMKQDIMETKDDENILNMYSNHSFYGPKDLDPSKASVLHGVRKIHDSKDQFISTPVEIMGSVLNANNSDVSAEPVKKSSYFGRLRKSSKTVFGGVKGRINFHVNKNFVHEGTLCNGCGMGPIIGGRWRCNTCNDVDLCTTCYNTGVHGFERSPELCKRIEELTMLNYKPLAMSGELLYLCRTKLCHNNVSHFRLINNWICDLVSGKRLEQMKQKTVVKSGIEAEVRSKIVGFLVPLACMREDIILQTEWFIEESEEEGENQLETLRLHVVSSRGGYSSSNTSMRSNSKESLSVDPPLSSTTSSETCKLSPRALTAEQIEETTPKTPTTPQTPTTPIDIDDAIDFEQPDSPPTISPLGSPIKISFKDNEANQMDRQVESNKGELYSPSQFFDAVEEKLSPSVTL